MQINSLSKQKHSYLIHAVVGDYINIMKTTFGYNFDIYETLNSMDTQNMETDSNSHLTHT